jgi:hypothetical protein
MMAVAVRELIGRVIHPVVLVVSHIDKPVVTRPAVGVDAIVTLKQNRSKNLLLQPVVVVREAQVLF